VDRGVDYRHAALLVEFGGDHVARRRNLDIDGNGAESNPLLLEPPPARGSGRGKACSGLLFAA
jgi:hypothetical protein